MTKAQINSGSNKSRLCVYLEYILLGLCLCVTGLRVTITEAPAPQTVNLSLNLTDNLYSVSLWSVLILSFICWFVWAFCSRRFFYRLTWIEFGLCLFAVSTVAAGFVAPDKRAAINDALLFIAPVLSALLLVQILDSRFKIKLVLCVIAAFGVVSAYKCHEQFSVTNQMDIEQYESAPDDMLEPFGIEAGSFNILFVEEVEQGLQILNIPLRKRQPKADSHPCILTISYTLYRPVKCSFSRSEFVVDWANAIETDPHIRNIVGFYLLGHVSSYQRAVS